MEIAALRKQFIGMPAFVYETCLEEAYHHLGKWHQKLKAVEQTAQRLTNLQVVSTSNNNNKHFSFPFWPLLPLNASGSTLL